ncbi:phage regulatory CII family protein [Achromobacter mucicolens]|uniref:phage regulatory CII family protein n=1 Tax=Achromobacter mucicolens TaxID=1389922 RepID=UPI00244A51D4|nr:phage regulatory CII family protein [Achromobacter mucicolens]MDH1522560.1 phage regulatory CII family protein [Achromobacter mucicolens]
MNITTAADLTVHDYKGGSEALGAVIGMSPAVLRNKVNPNNTTHHLTLAEADRIVRMTGDVRILAAFAHGNGYLLVKAPESCGESDMSVLEQVAALMIAHGRFGHEVYDALADGGVDQQEMLRVDAAGRALMEAVAAVARRLSGMAQQ